MPTYRVDYQSNRNVVYCCTYHVIWCPKFRRPVLEDAIAAELKRIMHAVATERFATIREVKVMPDPVHLVVEVDPQFGIHRLVKQMKGRSSRELRQQFPHLKTRLPTLWTNSYFVATVGGAPLEIVKQYIEQQKHA